VWFFAADSCHCDIFAGVGASAATKSEEGQGYFAAVERLWQRLSGRAEPEGFRFGADIGGTILVYEIDTGERTD
jgi:hypothetical protein